MEFKRFDTDYFKNETAQKSFWDFKGQEDFVDKWFLMSSPVPIVLITSLYLLFVLKVGPALMKKKQPFSLSNVLLCYNFIQVVVSVSILIFGIVILYPQGLIRRNCAMTKDEISLVATGIYCYFLAKISELLDTIFFVLRKKDNQVTFLHVYHHSLMVLSTWMALKYEPSYIPIFLGTLNSFIHVVMYTYYGLSTFPSIAKYLWWKKYITKMQLIQFMAIITEVVVNYYMSGCKNFSIFVYIIISNAALFIYLFADFYVKSYLKKQNDKDKVSQAKAPKLFNCHSIAHELQNDYKTHEKTL